MSSWNDVRLDEVVELQRGHDLPLKARLEGNIPVIGSNGVVGCHNEPKYSGPGVTIGRSGVIGGATFTDGPYWPLNTCLFVKDFMGNDPRWVYYWLKSVDFTAMDSGSAQPSLNRNYIASFPVSLPPAQEQRAIAEVLGALDDKIAANNKIAAISDEFIRTEYQKLLHESFETRIIGDFVEQRRESVNPENVSPTLPYIGLEHIPQRLLWSAEHGMSDEVSSNKSKFMSGDILFGKLRPYFHKVIAATETGICSTDVLVMTPLYDTLTGYILVAVSHDSVIREATASSSGTRMPRTNWKDLSAISIPWPGETKALDFSKTVSALQEHVISSLNENHTLASIRDTLLPQLMSGKIRVRDAEAVVEDVL